MLLFVLRLAPSVSIRISTCNSSGYTYLSSLMPTGMDQTDENRHPLANTQVPEWETPTHPRKSQRFSLNAFKGRAPSKNSRAEMYATAGGIANRGALPKVQTGPVQPAHQSTSHAEKLETRDQGLRQRRRWATPFYLRDRRVWIVGAIIVGVILALAIGLGVGLSKKNR